MKASLKTSPADDSFNKKRNFFSKLEDLSEKVYLFQLMTKPVPIIECKQRTGTLALNKIGKKPLEFKTFADYKVYSPQTRESKSLIPFINTGPEILNAIRSKPKTQMTTPKFRKSASVELSSLCCLKGVVPTHITALMSPASNTRR